MPPKVNSNNPESVVREIKRKTRRKFSTDEKIRIVLEGLKGEASIAECMLYVFKRIWTLCILT